ncbi:MULTISPECIES: L-threonylcarbamoyladenylate synthase [Mumia]|uniref:L-threonylcarbamoyladenylate synthase n=1 Tax=Mumia xiangluensis TaxID=1678900 RepID=A0ABW1QPE7_9ACTN
MSERFSCLDPDGRDEGLEAARLALRDGGLVVMPTDTVYGIAADAFDPAAVARLLAAKGRGRHMPPPVLVASNSTLDALASSVEPYVHTLTDALWPGPLTVICRQQESLTWDLGETRGTVAIRMPDDETARELLRRTGPLAVSSANLTGHPAATTIDEAEQQLGESVAVYLDGGPAGSGVPSTIVDCTGEHPRIVRMGAITADRFTELGVEVG